MEQQTSMQPGKRIAYWMAHALVIETVREPSHAHVLTTLRDADYRALLLLRCSNPDIRAFWLGMPSYSQAATEQTL
jgi:hypothetical protein